MKCLQVKVDFIVAVDELLLNSAIKSLHHPVDLGTSGIDELVLDFLRFQVSVKAFKELRAIVRLNGVNSVREIVWNFIKASLAW